MKIAFGTYGTPKLSPEKALKMLAEIGYDGVELMVAPDFPTSMDKLADASYRRRIKELISNLRLGIPALMILAGQRFLAPGQKAHEENLENLSEILDLAVDLGVGPPPVVVTMLGGRSDQWEELRSTLADRLRDWAEIAQGKGCFVAVEPHVANAVDRPDRAVWLIREVDSSAIRLNFDISHFAVQGMPLEPTVATLLPYTVHTHVKDGRMKDGRVKWLLPGEGDFDYVAYLRAMRSGGFDGYITVEVSVQIWSQDNYDPHRAAIFSYQTLKRAFEKAGIPRA